MLSDLRLKFSCSCEQERLKHQSAGASAAAGIVAIAISACILTEFVQDKQLLVGFGELAFDVGGVLRLNQRAGRLTFSGDSLFEFAGLHGGIVIQLCGLLGDVVVDCRAGRGNAVIDPGDILLGLAAALREGGLQIPLSELGLIAVLRDCVADIGKAAGDKVFELPDQIDLCGVCLTVVVCAGAEFRDVRRVSDGEIDSESPVSGAVAPAAVSAEAAPAAAPTAAPTAEQDQDQNPCPPAAEAIAEAVRVSVVIQESHSLPAVESAACRRVHIVDRNSIHNRYSFLLFLLFFLFVRMQRKFRNFTAERNLKLPSDFSKKNKFTYQLPSDFYFFGEHRGRVHIATETKRGSAIMEENVEKENPAVSAEEQGVTDVSSAGEPAETPESGTESEQASIPDAGNEQLRLENEVYQKHFAALNQEIEEIRRRFHAEPEAEVDPVQQLSSEVNSLKNGFDELKNMIANSRQETATQNPAQPQQGQPQAQQNMFQNPFGGYYQQPMFQQYSQPLFQASAIMPAPPLPYIQTPTIMPLNTQVPQINHIQSNLNGGK